MQKKHLKMIFYLTITFIFLTSITLLQAKWKCTQTIHYKASSVTFSPNGTELVASSSEKNLINFWNTQSWHQKQTKLKSSMVALFISFDSTGKWISLFFNEGNIDIFNATSKQKQRTIDTEGASPSTICFHPTKPLLYLFFYNGNIETWNISDQDPKNWKKESTCETQQRSIITVCFNNNGLKFASGTPDNSIIIWHTSDQDPANWKNKEILTGHTNTVNTLCFHPNINILASGSRDHTIKIWNLATGECQQTLDKEDGGHTDNVNSICFDHDGQWLASSSTDGTIKVWEDIPSSKLQGIKKHPFIPQTSPFSIVPKKSVAKHSYFQSFWEWLKNTPSRTKKIFMRVTGLTQHNQSSLQ